MTIAKITAGIILIIMAATWSKISIDIGYMFAVSENFMWLAGALGTLVTGGSAVDFIQKFQVKK